MIELMTVLTVAAVIAAVGIPSYRYVTTSNRISGEINTLLGDLQFARYEAIREGLPVTVCPATTSAPTTCDTSLTWSEGWIVLSNAASGYGAATVIRRQRPFTSLNSSDTLTASTGVNSLVFNREGFVTPAAAAKFTLTDPTANSGFTRCLMVSAAGAMSTVASGASLYAETC